MIPKIIHYCWFGTKEIPEKDKKNIEGWKKLNPDYKIMFWNETNYDINNCPNNYTKQAYNCKKLGFVPDYIRTEIIYNYGGFYFDTDVELLKPLDFLLDKKCIMGFQDENFVNHGQGFAAEPKNPVIKGLLEIYSELNFLNDDGSYNLVPSPVYLTNYLVTRGLVLNDKTQTIDGITVYSSEYFCPLDYVSKTSKITINTVSIHHYAESWLSPTEKLVSSIENIFSNLLPNRFGYKIGRVISLPFRVATKFKQMGLRGFFRFVTTRLVKK